MQTGILLSTIVIMALFFTIVYFLLRVIVLVAVLSCVHTSVYYIMFNSASPAWWRCLSRAAPAYIFSSPNRGRRGDALVRLYIHNKMRVFPHRTNRRNILTKRSSTSGRTGTATSTTPRVTRPSPTGLMTARRVEGGGKHWGSC